MSLAALSGARRSSLPLSLAIHAAVIGFVAALVWDRSPSERTETLPFEVYEAPKATLSPIRPAAPPLEQPEAEKPRAVFGANRGSVTSKQGIDVKAGNTVAKAPDTEKLQDDDADRLPIPTEEYLVTKMPELVSEIRVPYPRAAKEKGIEGAVVFDLLIDQDGKVREATLIEGPGRGLDEAAREAVLKFRFQPAYVEKKPVAVRIRYAYRFQLER